MGRSAMKERIKIKSILAITAFFGIAIILIFLGYPTEIVGK